MKSLVDLVLIVIGLIALGTILIAAFNTLSDWPKKPRRGSPVILENKIAKLRRIAAMKVELVWSEGPSAEEVLPQISELENRVVFSAEKGHNKHILSFESDDLAAALIISKRVAYLLGLIFGAVVWERRIGGFDLDSLVRK